MCKQALPFFISKTRVHDTHGCHCMLILALWNPADNSYEEKICGIPFFYILNSEDKNYIGMAIEIATVYFSWAVCFISKKSRNGKHSALWN